MLSGTESWKIDRHSLPVSALCKGSWNCNELQSGLFGMLLIFDANIWGEQTFWTTEKWQPKYLPFPVWSYPLDGSLQLSQILLCSLKISLYLSLSLCLSWPFSVFSLFSFSFCPHPPTHATPLSRFPSLCSTESNSGRPSPTGLCWRPTLRRWSVSPISSTLSLPPSVPFPLPLPSPFLFVTSVDTLTGRDSQTSQFPHGLGYFALGLQGIFSWLDYTPTHKKNLNSKSTPRAEDLNLP